jgi:hypothetical protein
MNLRETGCEAVVTTQGAKMGRALPARKLGFCKNKII